MVLLDENQSLISKKKKPAIIPTKFVRPNDWITPSIILAQISFFAFAWTFAGFMIHKTIPLPDNTAKWIQNNPSDTNVIITILSTILSLIGSYFLGRVVQRALVRRLAYAPLRFHTMVECAKLAQRSLSLSLERRYLSWTMLSIVWISLVSFLTTAWSSLLAPESIVIYHELQGNETDFLNPSVSDLFSNVASQLQGISQPAPGFDLNPGNNPVADLYSTSNFAASLIDAGFLTASANIHPTNFVSIYGSPYVSNVSTGGIFPPENIRFTPPASSSNLGIGDSSYQGLSTTYNITQQGFTANISCRPSMPNDPTITLNLMNSALVGTSIDDSWAVDTYSWSVECLNTEYSTLGITIVSGMTPGGRDQLPGEDGLFMTSVCFGQSFTGSSNQSFLVLLDSPSNASYSLFTPRICEVTPLITTVRTTYDQSGIINILQPPLGQQPLPDPSNTNDTGILMWFPALMIWTVFVKSQGLTSNMIGDNLMDPGLGTTNFDILIEQYLLGMTEYLGSYMAYAVSQVYNSDATVPFNGTINVHTFGWSFHPQTHGPALTAITLVTALTVAAGVFAMIPIDFYNGANQKRKLQASAYQFNPTAITDVLLASSTGDLARVLSEVDRDRLQSSTKGKHDDEILRVVLVLTEKGRPALKTVTTNIGAGASTDFSLSGDKTRLVADDNWTNSDTASRDETLELGSLSTITRIGE